MPIRIDKKLPAVEILRTENIFVMDDQRAAHQDIRPLKILILNLMPLKMVTETQLLRHLANTPLQLDIEFLYMESHQSKTTRSEHMKTFYKTFSEVQDQYFDGLIITGAPVEHLPFEEVDYWEEFTQVIDWSKTHVFSTLHICWGAQAALYYHYGIKKYPLKEKLFGIYPLKIDICHTMLLRGFDEVFNMPQSRHTEVHAEDIEKIPDLEIIANSKEAGVSIVRSRDKRNIFIMGHLEYDRMTLAKEYERDVKLGKSIKVPYNYYPNDDTSKEPLFVWRAHANLLFSNWINHHVYQGTPYDLTTLGKVPNFQI